MPEEVKALTRELHEANRQLRLVLNRLDDIEDRIDTERTRAWWHRGVSLLLVLLVAALALVAVEQRRSEAENCAAITEAFDVYTEALAAFASARAERTPEEQASFDARVDVFRAEIAARLADCS